MKKVKNRKGDQTHILNANLRIAVAKSGLTEKQILRRLKIPHHNFLCTTKQIPGYNARIIKYIEDLKINRPLNDKPMMGAVGTLADAFGQRSKKDELCEKATGCDRPDNEQNESEVLDDQQAESNQELERPQDRSSL